MTLTHIDPFSVLKFGAVAHLALAAIGVLALSIVLRVVLGSGLVEQVCDIAGDVGFLECGVDGGRVTRLLIVLALVWAVVQTALVVLLAFLHNLIADLTGGVTVTMDVQTPTTQAGRRPAAGEGGLGAVPAPTLQGPAPARPAPTVVARPGPASPNDETTTVETVDALEAITYHGVLGTITFPINTNNTPEQAGVEAKWWHQFPDPAITVVQYQEQGQSSTDAPVVYPPVYQTGDAIWPHQ
jgi:hypothetical protein